MPQVHNRYKQYFHQMQNVVSSFDVIAGRGAAKPYTALALQTISRHFRCLHDAITGQISATQKCLGEQDSAGNNNKGVGISRLRYVDQQIRQQRALQQLGVMHHAWRPQRGLPEGSVSILRAWLFEHFLHPYSSFSLFTFFYFVPRLFVFTYLLAIFSCFIAIPKILKRQC